MVWLFFAAISVLASIDPGSCNTEAKPFVVQAGTRFNERNYQSYLTVLNGGEFGNWTWPEMCPEGFYAEGFSLRVEPKQYALDDTALNGIRLYCSKPNERTFLYSVESHIGYYGDWSDPQWCPSGILNSFQLRVEPHRGLFGDDTAANNIRFRCSSNPTLEGPGMDWGEYGQWSQKCSGTGICGIETKMEPYQDGLDDSSLNDVRFLCCT